MRRRRLALMVVLCSGCGKDSVPDPGSSVIPSSGSGTTDSDSTTRSETEPDSTTGTTASIGGLSPTVACDAYLACAAATIPTELGPLLGTYGPDGTCWQSTPDVAEQCDSACEVGRMQLHDSFPDEAACGDAITSSTGHSSGDTSTCGESDAGGMQPDEGMYAPCEEPADCIGLGVCAEGFCTGECSDAAQDCDPAPGDSAIAACLLLGDTGFCVLDCGGCGTCPAPMECTTFEGDSICV
jgi:hypothetical protein